MKGKVVKCPVCGAGDIEHRHDMIYACKYCESLFRAPADIDAASRYERDEGPLFTCASCKKPYFSNDWHLYAKTSLNNMSSTVGKKISVSYALHHCPGCHGLVCTRCIDEGRFRKKHCTKCGKGLEETSGVFVVQDLKEVPEMFRRVFLRHSGKC